MQRRSVLRGLCASVSLCALGGPTWLMPSQAKADAATPQSSVPVIMFHKVDDTPRYPEDIASAQLAAVLNHAWKAGFRPVNVSDLLQNRLDSVVPKGLKPLCITADDSHPSVVFSKKTGHRQARNASSLVEVLRQSLIPHTYAPRASFFLTSTADDRAYAKGNGYFGSVQPLPAVLDVLAADPGIETGYHTRTHVNMKGMGAAKVRALLENQMHDFKRLGVLERITRILAYPYGVRPSDEGITALRDMGFLGAVLAYPGVNEARHTTLPACTYNGTLGTDPFLIPRVNIGAYIYAQAAKARDSKFNDINPLDDFRKDVEQALPHIYVSRGTART